MTSKIKIISMQIVEMNKIWIDINVLEEFFGCREVVNFSATLFKVL